MTHSAATRSTGLPPTALVFALLVLTAAPLSAQPRFMVTMGHALGSLGETGVASEARQTTAGAVEAEHVAAAGRLRLFYALDAGTYATPGDWHYYMHNAGGTWRVKLGEKTQNSLYVGGSGSWRANGVSWSAADYRALAAFANAEFHPSARTTARFGYRLDARAFPDLAELDQVQHDGFVSLLVNLPTRTTFIGEAHVGAKSYADTVSAPTTSDLPIVATSGIGQRRQGGGMGPSLRGSMTIAGSGSVERNRAGMVTWLARAAQSLTDRTGASLQYSQRATFGRVAPFVVTTPALYVDDGVYDDPFASDARSATAMVVHAFAGGMTIEASASQTLKDYGGVLALDLDGATLPGLVPRADRILRASAAWTVPLLPSRSGPFSVGLDIGYHFTRHRSNDAFYNYTSHAVGIGATVSY